MPRTRNSLITGAFQRHGAPYAKRLSVHSSCVNALAWSGDGRWLASAGDDKHIVLWDFHPLDELSNPFVCTGPRGNILCLAFSASNSYILSGGLDEEVLQYDVSRMSASRIGTDVPILRRFSQHDGSIRAISPHLYADNVLLTGSEDGLVILHDVRVPSGETVGSLSLNVEVTGVQFHPTMEHLFVTSDGGGNCHLRDTRMTFSGGASPAKSLLKYVTTLSKPGSLSMSNPEVSSVVFDSTGTQLAVTMLNYLPTIFNVWDEWPLATCSGGAPLSGAAALGSGHSPLETAYVNGCTIKQGSFGRAGLHRDTYYGAGSDDFLGYVWHLPEISELTSRRIERSNAQWAAEPVEGCIGFAKSAAGRRVVPVALQSPQFVLYGHKSIVNTLLFHPLEPYIATSGVERHVLVHSPFEATATLGQLARTESKVRRRSERGTGRSRVSLNAPIEADDDDERMIALFDEILRREGTEDIWDTRQWNGDSSDSPSSSDLDVGPDSDAESDERRDGSQSED